MVRLFTILFRAVVFVAALVIWVLCIVFASGDSRHGKRGRRDHH